MRAVRRIQIAQNERRNRLTQTTRAQASFRPSRKILNESVKKQEEQQATMTSNNIQMKDTNDGVVVKADGRTLLAKLVFAGSARLAECDLGIDELRAAFKHAHGDEASKVRIRCL